MASRLRAVSWGLVCSTSIPLLCFPGTRDQQEEWMTYLQMDEPSIWSNRSTVVSCGVPSGSHIRLRLSHVQLSRVLATGGIQLYPSLGILLDQRTLSPVRCRTPPTPTLPRAVAYDQWFSVERVQSISSLDSMETILNNNNGSRAVYKISWSLSCKFIRFQLHPLPNPPSLTPDQCGFL